jgi:hypothetical protein
MIIEKHGKLFGALRIEKMLARANALKNMQDWQINFHAITMRSLAFAGREGRSEN